MAAIIGTTGSVTHSNGGIINVRLWSGSIVEGTVDTTPFAPTANARTTLGTGISVMTGTIEGYLDATTPFSETEYEDSTPTAAVFTLVASDTGGVTQKVTYTFSGFLTGWSVSVGKVEVNTYTASFVSTGAVTNALS